MRVYVGEDGPQSRRVLAYCCPHSASCLHLCDSSLHGMLIALFFLKGEDFSLKTAVPEVLPSLNNDDL